MRPSPGELARSLAFNIAFFLNFLLWGVLLLPLMVGPRRTMLAGAKAWARTSIWLARAIVGLEIEYRGWDKIPAGGLLVVAKHQSALETLALVTVFEDPTYVLKRELMWIPFFGWYAWKAGMIPVDRGARSRALAGIARGARAARDAGRQIIIFPEGTRRAPGAPPVYKFGAAFLYSELGSPALPVALDTGLFWPRRSFAKRGGRTVIEFLDPLEPGLPRDKVLGVLEERIENATARLIAEAPARRLPQGGPTRAVESVAD